jgi:hypothetical protein
MPTMPHPGGDTVRILLVGGPEHGRRVRVPARHWPGLHQVVMPTRREAAYVEDDQDLLLPEVTVYRRVTLTPGAAQVLGVHPTFPLYAAPGAALDVLEVRDALEVAQERERLDQEEAAREAERDRIARLPVATIYPPSYPMPAGRFRVERHADGTVVLHPYA